MLRPPGRSSISANKRRAWGRRELSGEAPVKAVISAIKRSSDAVAQTPNWRWIRSRISAAAALVKVRQRIAPGFAPERRSRNTLSVKTFVFPVPALADTHAEWEGFEARFCVIKEGGKVTELPDFAKNIKYG
jgi:hypothetical protein